VSEHAPIRGDIAIIGMACLFPGAPSLGAYWRNIVGKVDAIGEPPEDWLSGAAAPEPGADSDIYCRRGGYLGDLARFNPIEYGIMPNSIDGADPDQFLALRVAHEALADAGYADRPLSRERTQVVLGRGAYINRGYGNLMQQGQVLDQTMRILRTVLADRSPEDLAAIRRELKASLPPFNAETASGLVPNLVSGRIANRMDFMGGSFTVDAACASALIALEIAVRDLLTHRCDAAVVGGVQASTPPPIHTIFCTLGALSRKNQIRPFDRGADGTMLGEGVGVVVLKRREDAERDGDRIYALVKGIGSASDGRALGVLAPRVEGEVLAVRRAYEASGISPQTIGLIEAHGTATPVGDATEIQALRQVFGERVGAPSCALGSVKSMIGHTLPAAGVAGLIKAALSLHHKVLPPTLHCEEPDPRLELDRTPFYLNGETRPWIHGAVDAPRRAGVNAFGFGGINAHVVLEEYTGPRATTPSARIREVPASVDLHDEWDSEVLILAGHSRDELITRGEALHRRLGEGTAGALKDLAYTLNVSQARADATTRLTLVAATVPEAREKLAHALGRLRDRTCTRIRERSGIYFFAEPLGAAGKLAFLFPGEGSQYVNMLADLCLHFPDVRASFDLIDRAFADHGRGYLPSQLIFPAPVGEGAAAAEERLWRMDAGAEAVFVASHALCGLLTRLEIRPDAVVGHSTGEYSALLAAGAVAVKDETEFVRRIADLNAIYERMAREGRIPRAGLVAIGGADPSLLASVVAGSGGALSIAMDNCPHQVVLCGPEPILAEALGTLRRAGAICKTLPFDRAYHTPRFADVSDAFRAFFASLLIQAPRIDLYSCVTAAPYPTQPDEIRDLGAAQWSRPVRFRETITAMHEAGVRLFVEVGPRSNLTGFVDDILRGKPYAAIASNVTRHSGITQLHHLLAVLAAHGVSMRLDALYARRAPTVVSLEASDGPEKRERSGALRLSLGLPAITLKAERHTRSEERATASEVGMLPAERGPSTNGRSTNGATLTPADDKLAVAPPAPAQAGRATPVTERATLVSRPATIVPTPVPPARTSPPAAARAVHAHLETMDTFLRTQEDVMRGYLQRTRPPAPPAASPVPLPPRAIAPPAASMPPPTSAAPVSTAPVPIGAGAPVVPDIARALLAIVSDKTGYPVEMLDVSAQMEADLGIDSIKRVEVLGAFQHQHGLVQSGDMEALSRLKTLGEIIAFLTTRSPGPGVARHPFVGEMISLVAGQELVARRTIDVEHEDLFLQDHTLGGRVSVGDPSLRALPVMPLTMSMEMLAQAAAVLEPGRPVIGMRDIRGHRWMAFDQGRLTLRMVARRLGPNEIRADVREETGDGAETKAPILEATVIFGSRYPDAPTAEPLALRNERPSTWTVDRLYGAAMFHGPRLQGVASMNRWGEDGAEATLQALPADRLFASEARPTLCTDPVILDAAGQVVGYWIAEHMATGVHVFPYRVEAVDFYGPALAAPARAACRARIALVGDEQVRSTLDVVADDGRLHARILGWEDRRFAMPQSFYEARTAPATSFLSAAWPCPLAGLSADRGLECARMDQFPSDFLESGGGIWRRVLAHLVLARGERQTWAALEGPSKRRDEWLLGRVAAKDAARRFLAARHGLDLAAADIEIAVDEHGRPGLAGAWRSRLSSAPVLSIAHTRGVAIAVVGDGAWYRGVGVDIEPTGRLHEGFDQVAFTDSERQLLTSLEPLDPAEWRLRFWCAKEAVAKALGRGLGGRPRGFVVVRVDPDTGTVSVSLDAEQRRQLDITIAGPLEARTFRDAEFVGAMAALPE
jgi:acyl transferase domain-containing protein/phosphopantetheinyl transferase/acyl carrier protein